MRSIPQRLQATHPERGAAIILAMIFITVVGLLGGALAEFASSSLGQTSILQSGRSLAYSAASAVDVRIQQIRELNSQDTAPGYAATPNCPSVIGQPVYGADANGTALSGQSLSVTCTVAFPSPFVRSIDFVAHSGGVGGTPVIDATVTYVDINTPIGCSQVITGANGRYVQPCFAPATSVFITSWDIKAADG
jgi:Tfp pilus assembly protein PilX